MLGLKGTVSRVRECAVDRSKLEKVGPTFSSLRGKNKMASTSGGGHDDK